MSNEMDFPYGDLVVLCHQCGEKQVVEEMVTDGRALYLFNKENSYVRLSCPKCNIALEMRLIPTSVEIPTVEEELKNDTENEELPKETPAEEVVQ